MSKKKENFLSESVPLQVNKGDTFSKEYLLVGVDLI